MSEDIFEESSKSISLNLFETTSITSSNTNESGLVLPTIYKIKKAEDTIKIAKVFAL